MPRRAGESSRSCPGHVRLWLLQGTAICHKGSSLRAEGCQHPTPQEIPPPEVNVHHRVPGDALKQLCSSEGERNTGMIPNAGEEGRSFPGVPISGIRVNPSGREGLQTLPPTPLVGQGCPKHGMWPGHTRGLLVCSPGRILRRPAPAAALRPHMPGHMLHPRRGVLGGPPGQEKGHPSMWEQVGFREPSGTRGVGRMPGDCGRRHVVNVSAQQQQQQHKGTRGC